MDGMEDLAPTESGGGSSGLERVLPYGVSASVDMHRLHELCVTHRFVLFYC